MISKREAWYTDEDVEVVEMLEGRFNLPVVFLLRVCKPTPETHGYSYWHVRVKGVPGVAFVRKDSFDDYHLYGPIASDRLNRG